MITLKQTERHLLGAKRDIDSLAKNNDLFTYLKKIVGKAKLRRYVDPESGLQSVNHFILSD